MSLLFAETYSLFFSGIYEFDLISLNGSNVVKIINKDPKGINFVHAPLSCFGIVNVIID